MALACFIAHGNVHVYLIPAPDQKQTHRPTILHFDTAKNSDQFFLYNAEEKKTHGAHLIRAFLTHFNKKNRFFRLKKN